jgi:hypothetical protein
MIMLRSISNRCRCLSLSLLFAAAVFAQELRLTFADGEYRLEGWKGGSQPPAAGWQSIFPVYAGSSQTPMLGAYTVEGDALIFRPRFPVEPGTCIHGSFPGGGFACGGKPKPSPTGHVEGIYPSAAVLPANTLRFYIYFSAPMSIGDALQHIRLMDEAGRPVSDAFLDQELWDPDHKRLTLLLDPGRIKRGLVPASQMGTPIQEGKQYTLIIERSWPDAGGVPLAEEFSKAFIGAPAERTPADAKLWSITAPKAGTPEPLIVYFPRPMDYALLQRMLSVSGVRGTVAVAANETEWRFTPDVPWIVHTYTLEAETDLEDICGNHLDRPFDIDLHLLPPAQPGNRTVSIPFFVK